jgi:pyrimidine-nucleoside phosphorylase/thymidine phosphorylase
VTWDPREPIAAKRDARAVGSDQIERLVGEYAAGALGDGPMAAFLMAAVINGMDAEETSAMTRAFVASGATVSLGDIGRPVVDKHSTGGVSDAVSLLFAPLAACLGLACVKISGRGLGHTGGTIDKLEAIPGFRVDRTIEEMRTQAAAIGCVIASQTSQLVPADGMVYALRDATATVASIPLIAASVMSKKFAIDSDLIVLDVKQGSGAFMPDVASARALAEACVALASSHRRRATAAVTDMSQPLGTTIGNALEVAEAIEILRGERRGRLRDLAVWFAARASAVLAGGTVEEATLRAERALGDGSALEVFRALVEAQGGRGLVVDDPVGVLPAAPVRLLIEADADGWVAGVDAAAIGAAATALGAGRHRKGAPIDPAVGIVLTAKVADTVGRGEVIGEVHARSEDAATVTRAAVLAALTLSDGPVAAAPLVAASLGEVAA